MILLTIALVISLSCNAAADTFSYVDQYEEMTLPIPEDWQISAKDDCIHFKTKETKVSISYRSEDLWDGLSRADKNDMPRQEFNNDIMSKADVADLIGAKAKDVSFTELGNIEYFTATTTVTKGFFIFKTTSSTTSLLHFHNGIMYLFQFAADPQHKDYPLFEELVSNAQYPEVPVPAETESIPETTAYVQTDADIYREAQTAYNKGLLTEAEELFSCVPGYEDAQDYLRLIRIRDYGSNTGIGCVYNFNKGLMDFQKDDIDKAAERFYFADTAEVLLCNTDVACYYLFGNWVTPAGSPAYAYFKLHKDAVGGYYYTRSTNLSNAVSDCVSIIDGDVRISIISSNTLVFHIDLTAPDCMEIYSYETCKSFTLQRN